MSNSGKFISYGCRKDHDFSGDERPTHHFFDYGLTGLGIGYQGHSEYALCRKARYADYRLYMQCLPMEVIKDAIEAADAEQSGFEVTFCKECCIKIRRWLQEFDI